MSVPTMVVANGIFNTELLNEETRQGRVALTYGSFATPEEVRSATAGADAVMVTVQKLDAASIEAFDPTVRIIGRAGIGLDAIDLEAAKARGVAVFHTPDYCIDEVASHALALMLALYRRLPQSDVVARTAWSDWRSIGTIKSLAEITVGIVGFGRIGRAFAVLLKPLGVDIVIYDPWIDDAVATPGMQRARTVDELFGLADIVSLHLPLTDETRNLINKSSIAKMRPGAILINVSRGGLVDEPALAAALQAGRLTGAGLDVRVDEPPPRDSPLLSAPNALFSPHTAWYSTASEARVWRETIDGVLAYLRHESPATGRLAVQP